MRGHSMTPIAVLASGRGSNFDALAKAVRNGQLHAHIRVVISDRADAPVLEKARQLGIEAIHVPAFGRRPEDREVHDAQIVRILRERHIQWVVLAGYMRLVSHVLLEAFRDSRGFTRVVNIHPSLLPAFPGVGGYRQAFDHGAQVAGVTVHLVELDLDNGPIVAQAGFSLDGCQTADEVEGRGLELEHRLYAAALEKLLTGRFRIDRTATGRIRVLPS
jgi:phosphoribosylglycinamide formyltransferase-1